jgi:hypothetical protein
LDTGKRDEALLVVSSDEEKEKMFKPGRDGRNLYVSTCDGEALEEWRRMLGMVGKATHIEECPACVEWLGEAL